MAMLKEPIWRESEEVEEIEPVPIPAGILCCAVLSSVWCIAIYGSGTNDCNIGTIFCTLLPVTLIYLLYKKLEAFVTLYKSDVLALGKEEAQARNSERYHRSMTVYQLEQIEKTKEKNKIIDAKNEKVREEKRLQAEYKEATRIHKTEIL